MLSAIASDVANRGKTSYFVNKDKKSVQLTLFFCLYLLMLFLFYPNTPAQAAAYLAMVVPETWLSRDYAAPIQYLLLKCFRVETVAIDTNASWFPEAPVKTCLIKLQNDKVTNIMRWLEENICNPNLSLEMIAQEFGHSSTYWSRHFQELSGQRFSDFIWAKRLTLVKQKLRSTDASIKEVVQSVGYWNVASFARRFRKEEGLTINQWRELENRKSGA